jgi:hypothetical protein
LAALLPLARKARGRSCKKERKGNPALLELAANVVGTIVKYPVQDTAVLEECLETVLKKRHDDSA